MGHHHHHHHGDPSEMGERRLWWAVGANMLLTAAQVVGGIISGSLSLIADALHNFSDAAALLIALVAIRIGKKPPDQFKTFGYKRAETIAALINLTTLIIIGLYLCYEAIMRFITPEPIVGWTVIIVAGIALVIDVFTALLTYSQSKHSMNIRAAFLHNVTDALASVGVIIAGTLILLYGWVWTDATMTLLIAGYVLYQGITEIPKAIHLLMEGTPEDINVGDVITKMEAVSGVQNVHHVHIWQLDEQRNALEAHVVVNKLSETHTVKLNLKATLYNEFKIMHSTLEFEEERCEEEVCTTLSI
ncbi:MAG: cation transporter [Alphaproteobacteria bacterium]|nr:cation transporter [Alphaproteobacteria bacterium]|tara:strand:+ start:7222 stop:8130 length:909 start_codon:yes stop_codon:yes gene_type:complete